MENLRTGLLDLINGLGEERSMDALNGAMNNMGFRINFDAVGHRLQDYIDSETRFVDGDACPIKNVIITSPTQVGKTAYIIENCKRNKNRPYLFVMTCDNSKAQMKQLKNRLLDNGIVGHDLGSATKAKLEDVLRDGKCAYLVVLNNDCQIKKLESLVNSIRVRYRPKQYVVFHDEADTVNKADAGTEIDDLSVAISHRRWNQFFDTLSGRGEMVKRFWVSATPENCSLISGITGKDIVVLPVPSGYVGVTENVEWTDTDSGASLGMEIRRVRELDNGEVILYCLDKKKDTQDTLARDISFRYNCISFTYNGDGFCIYRGGDVLVLGLRGCDDISTVLDKLRGQGPVVVVGYNLMNRGISFVAGPNTGSGYERVNPPPTATVMFYSGGRSSHMVGLAQRFGRICGTSRPDLTRRVVYCSNAVYKDYLAYLENQKVVFSLLGSGSGSDKTMSEILGDSGRATKLKRPLDRPNLRIVNKEYSGSCSGGSDTGDWDFDKMHRLVDSWSRVDNNAAVARLFRRMVACGGKMESGLVREMIGNNAYGSVSGFNRKNNWSLVFRKNGRYHYIKDEVLEYLG